jgi:hypothetical protein
MPKLGEALRDVSTTAKVPSPGIYQAQIKVEDTKSKNQKAMTVVTYTIIGTDFDGNELKEYFVTEGKDGGYNEAALRGLKRLAVAALGEEVANSDDFDTEMLNDVTVSILVKADAYEDEDLKAAGVGPEEYIIQTARVKRVLGPA